MGSQFSGQLLSVSSVKEGEVDQSKLFFVNKADAQWVQLQKHKPGWVAVLPKLRSFIAPRGFFEGQEGCRHRLLFGSSRQRSQGSLLEGSSVV